MAVKSSQKNKLSVVVISATLLTTAVCIKAYEPDAYEVSVNGNPVAYVRDKCMAEGINREIINELNTRYNYKLEDKVVFNRIIAADNIISVKDEIRDGILSALNTKVTAVEMKVDGKSVCLLANQEEGKKLIDSISQYYLSKCSLEEKRVSGIKNEVSYEAKQINPVAMDSYGQISDRILKEIQEGRRNDFVVEITGKLIEKKPISHATVINYSSTLEKGKSKTITDGADGVKQVEKEVVYVNGTVTKEKVVKENVISKAIDTVILKGSKTAVAASSSSVNNSSAMTVLSRGSISSNFGERWGRMHNGIDIASATGTPIFAALAGKVSYAGWEDGYGKVIKVSNSNGLETIYGHCSSIQVTKGQSISKGQSIGKVGSTGNSTGPHLHFEVRSNGKPINPVPYIWR